jgi:SOS-response transcriptional repressor LexA
MQDFSKFFFELRKSLGKSQQEMADFLGCSQRSWANYEKGTQPPAKLLAAIVEKGYNIPGLPPVFYGDPVPIDVATILNDKRSFIVPLLDMKLSAGRGTELAPEDEVCGYIPVPSYLSSYGEKLAAMTVAGDSMYPTLSRGDLVVCDSCGWSGEGIYAVRVGGDGLVKRVTKAPGKVVVISDNPKYPSYEISEDSQDFELIGRVHCAIKKLE